MSGPPEFTLSISNFSEIKYLTYVGRTNQVCNLLQEQHKSEMSLEFMSWWCHGSANFSIFGWILYGFLVSQLENNTFFLHKKLENYIFFNEKAGKPSLKKTGNPDYYYYYYYY